MHVDSAMLLDCPTCGDRIRADDISLQNTMAKCSACDTVFSFGDTVGETSDSETDRSRSRLQLPLPKGIKIEDWGPNLKLIRSWFTPLVFALVLFCLIWNGFLIFWYKMAATGLGSAGGAGDTFRWLFLILPIGHVAVGLGLAYFTVCCFANKTTIEFRGDRLTVQHGPLPWPGRKDLDATHIEQLFCRERVRHGRNGSHTTYELHAILRAGGRLKLLSGLTDPDQAHYVEQQIEARLQIADRAVAGEYV